MITVSIYNIYVYLLETVIQSPSLQYIHDIQL